MATFRQESKNVPDCLVQKGDGFEPQCLFSGKRQVVARSLSLFLDRPLSFVE